MLHVQLAGWVSRSPFTIASPSRPPCSLSSNFGNGATDGNDPLPFILQLREASCLQGDAACSMWDYDKHEAARWDLVS